MEWLDRYPIPCLGKLHWEKCLGCASLILTRDHFMLRSSYISSDCLMDEELHIQLYLLIQDMGWILVMAKHESLNSTRGVRGRKTCARTHGLVVDQWMTQWLGFMCRHRIKRFPWSRWRRLTIESKTEFKGNFIFWMARHCVLCLPWPNMFGKREWICTLTLTTLYCNTFKFFHCGIWPPLYAMFSLILACMV
jgi:hypothetical protein